MSDMPEGLSKMEIMKWKRDKKAQMASGLSAPLAGGGPPPPGPPAAPAALAAPVDRKAELEAMPAFKLKGAAKAAGVPAVAIGMPARSKDDTVAAILEAEGK